MSADVRNRLNIRRSLSVRIVPRTHDSDAKEFEKCEVLLLTVRGIHMRHSMQLVKMMKRPLLLAVIATFAAGCSTMEPSQQVSSEPRSLVGPRGADGPAGPDGMRGPVGATGAMGAPLAGPAGADGPAGPAGIQGPVGATGSQGIAVVGPAGETGATGPAGAQGAIGYTGAQGSSMAGPAGATGRAGPAGTAGEVRHDFGIASLHAAGFRHAR